MLLPKSESSPKKSTGTTSYDRRAVVPKARTGLDTKPGLIPTSTCWSPRPLLLGDEQTLNNLQVEQMTSAVALIEALGGGWDRSQLPGTKEVTQRPSQPETVQQ